MKKLMTAILQYLKEAQVLKAGRYYGSIWSEKAWHAPGPDWNKGGAHHYRSAGSTGLAFWRAGEHQRAEQAFDWLVSCQNPRGGWAEIQNNDRPSDWEYTGEEELSTIETSFAIRGLASAILLGLPPKKSYLDSLRKAGLWLLGMETPVWSGVFPHHERSPFDTPNATMHACEALSLIYRALHSVYGIPVHIFRMGAVRAFRHILSQQQKDGNIPYRFFDGKLISFDLKPVPPQDAPYQAFSGITINYTALVLYLMLNIMELGDYDPEAEGKKQAEEFLRKGNDFLVHSIAPDGSLRWDEFETSSAKHNLWTCVLVWNVLVRSGRSEAAGRLKSKILSLQTRDGLLPMRDDDSSVTRCAYMQADMYLFLSEGEK